MGGSIYSGVTLTNTGVACALPTEVSSAAVVDGNGAVVRQAGYNVSSTMSTIPSAGVATVSPDAASPEAEFVNAPIISTSGGATVYGYTADNLSVEQLELATGGKAELIITSAFSDQAVESSCLAPPSGGGLTIALFGSGALTAPVPMMPAPQGGADNPTGSAFFECSTSVMSPFITWDAAASFVISGIAYSVQGGTVPNKDNAIWGLAP
jgi:hypothetical protein